MIEIVEEKKYLKDISKLKSLPKNKRDTIFNNLNEVILLLLNNKQLPSQYQDHKLHGFKENLNIRECHILPNICLIYKLDGNRLSLLRIGNHSNLNLTENF